MTLYVVQAGAGKRPKETVGMFFSEDAADEFCKRVLTPKRQEFEVCTMAGLIGTPNDVEFVIWSNLAQEP